jgi:hypothetical protein
MGRTDGERIEGTWGEAKQAGGMTKEMNAGHRHDTLNDFFNDWNWVKAQNLGLCSLFFVYSKAHAYITSCFSLSLIYKGKTDGYGTTRAFSWTVHSPWADIG